MLFVNLNEKKFIAEISSKIHNHTRGEVQIGDLSVSLIRTFPVLSLQLSNVTLRDSLYAIHKKDFLRAGDVYISYNVAELVTGSTTIGRVLLRNASVNIITDSTGYTNEYLFKSKKQQKPNDEPSYPTIILNRVKVTYINPLRNKLHEANVRNLRCQIKEKEGVLNIALKMDMLVNRLTFNTNKGSYLKEKKLEANFVLRYDKQMRDLLINNIRLNIDNHPFYFNGKFHIDKVSPDYNLSINTYKIKYDNAVSIMSDTLQSGLGHYSFNKPIDISVVLNGKTLFRYVPSARIITELDLQSTNNFGSTAFDLVKGKAVVNLLLDGPAGRADTVDQKMEGKIDISDVEVKYLPRNFTLKNLKGRIRFMNEDLLAERFVANAGSTKLEMNGIAKKFVSLLDEEREKMDVRWKISSPSVKLEDFKTFLSQTQSSSKRNNKSASSRIDKFFADRDMYVLLATPEMTYKTFRATNVEANVIMKKSEIALDKVSFKHAKGTMEVKGTLQNGKQWNPVTLHTRMRNMDVPLLFAAFNNFGQDAITNKNLKGTLSADVHLQTAVTNQAELVTSMSEGTIGFILENGELNNFAPLQEIGNKVFKKQDFSTISFANLENTLELKGTAFIVHPMDIRSTALNLSVEGIYDYKKGTDMSIRLPLRNLTKSQANTDLGDGVKAKKGVSLRLRARTENGKLKVSWDPFRRAIKNKEDVKDSAESKKS
jgi:hypothetical protein